MAKITITIPTINHAWRQQSNPSPLLNRRRNEENSNAHDGGNASAAAAAVAAAGLDSIEARPEHAADLLVTEKFTVASFPKYRRMCAEMMRWWEKHYPALYNEIVFNLTEEDKKDSS